MFCVYLFLFLGGSVFVCVVSCWLAFFHVPPPPPLSVEVPLDQRRVRDSLDVPFSGTTIITV